MPTGGRARPDVLVDTSVAIALVVADHTGHETAVRALGRRRLGLAGHAAFETFSVLTRMPPPTRREPHEVALLLGSSFPATRFLDVPATRALLARLPGLGIAGGAVYDALVGEAAAAHGLTLATRDLRAVEVYRSLDVELRLID